MADIIGAIERALGAILNGIYEVIPIYGLGIILLTLAVRSVLIPLTVKQIKGFAAQQKVAPEMKKIQQKYRVMQQKAKDRSEVQQIRLAMNKEMQELYQAHGASMMGGCLPMLGQFPVLIAMFAVFRASIVALPMVATFNGAPIPATLFDEKALKSTICRPVADPSAEGASPTQITCPTKEGERTFTIGDLRDAHDTSIKFDNAPWITACKPQKDSKNEANIVFTCQSQLGTGHLPRDGALFEQITEGRVSLFGLEAGCSASQAQSKDRIKECATGENGGVAKSIPYYLLVLAVAGTTYYQSKQMMARSTGQMAQQQQMMTRIMPVLFGFLSISFPAALNLYMLTTNVFSIGQQGLLFKKMGARLGLPEPTAPPQQKIKDTKPAKAPERPVAGDQVDRKKSNKSKKGKKRR